MDGRGIGVLGSRRGSVHGRRRAGVLLACIVAMVASLVVAGTGAAAAVVVPQIEVLSNRADLLSGGDARVAIDLPVGTEPAAVRVRLGERDVGDGFAWRANGRYEALLEDILVGEHELTAQVGDGPVGRTELVMHPNEGPVFSGPHVQPWRCQPTARDDGCNEPARYEYRYRTTTGSWQSYDPEDPPASGVATTVTDEGHEVPFVVRIETGYQNRDQYRIAVLFDADRGWEPWQPQAAWNHKVLINHGASCGTTYSAGSAPDVLDATALGRGFVVMSTALNNAGHNCNLVTQAESLVMAKERIVERYGDIRYTIGTGCSGGSLTQQQVANAYPGIYQGILPACSFPDAWSTGQQLIDAFGGNRYFHDPTRWAPGVVWDPLSIAAVEGHPNHVNSVVFESVYWNALGNPTSGCSDVPAAQRYHPQTNPGGVRCTLMDHMINVLGPRPEERWSPMEQAAGRGFAGIPLDNVGVQYGLEALRRGQITAAQFVDLNVQAGGGDIDTNRTVERLEADQPALRNSYLSGAVNTGNNLDQVAIIDLRGPDHGAFHDAYRSWTIRARLEREHGHFDNHVIWVGHVPLFGDPSWADEALLVMDRWLQAVEEDRSDAPLAERIVANRPADLQDRCSQVPGVELVEVPGIGRVCEHEHVQSRYGTPRTVAGSGIETDIQKCMLQPHRRQDYYPVVFTDTQWEALQAVFPDGVCDYSQPGVDQVGTIPWRSYQDGPEGDVVHGGRSLGPAPPGSGGGWTDPAFASWLDAEGAIDEDPGPDAEDPSSTKPGRGNGDEHPGRGQGRAGEQQAAAATDGGGHASPAGPNTGSTEAGWFRRVLGLLGSR